MGTSGVNGANSPHTTSETDTDYSWSEWGQNEIYEGTTKHAVNTWRTMTKEEWTYLFKTRQVNGEAGYSFVTLRYADDASINGIIIYPDNFSWADVGVSPIALGDGSTTTIDASTWIALENLNCVFLPKTGDRKGIRYYYDAFVAQYWSATEYDDNIRAYSTHIWCDRGFSISTGILASRSEGESVRLVKDVE